MRSVWKFPLKLDEFQVVEMPMFAEILCVQMQQGTPTIWASVETNNDPEGRQIAIVGTGHPAPPPEQSDYIGTVQMDAYVWHVFAEKEDE